MSVNPSELLNWLVQTKFLCPLPDPDLVERPRLVETLYAALTTHRLTLVAAPAGSGKTTLVASLPSAFPRLPLAWFALDKEDGELTRFVTALVVALRQLNPGFGENTLTLLSRLSDSSKEVPRLAGILINEIMQSFSEPFALVLDDLHWINEPVIFVLLDYLIERLPPQMHLVIATRHDPPLALARLRARGQLAELRLGELRFTGEEAADYLNNRLQLHLAESDLQRLQQRTEGWAAGLRLLANSLQKRAGGPERRAFIEKLASQTDRYIFEYLAEEVLNQQIPEVRTFLLQTSILTELTPATCAAVTGTGSEATSAMLDQLYHHNLFIIAVDDQHQSYRYHDLFASFLQGQLLKERPQEVALLHARAAKAQPLADPAIRHYLAAGLWEEAVQTIEEAGRSLTRRGLISVLCQWILALPDEVVARNPRLDFYLGVYFLRRDRLDQARFRLERAHSTFRERKDDAGQGAALIRLSSLFLLEGDYSKASATISEGLQLNLPSEHRIHLLLKQSWLKILQGEWEEAARYLRASEAVIPRPGEETEYGVDLVLDAPFVLVEGGLEMLERHYQELRPDTNQTRLEESDALCLQSFILLLHGKPDEALKIARRASEVNSELEDITLLSVEISRLVALNLFVQGDYRTITAYLGERLPGLAQVLVIKPWYGMLLYLLGRAWWEQGEAEKARGVYEELSRQRSSKELPGTEVVQLMLAAQLQISEKRFSEAEKLLTRAVELEKQTRLSQLFGSAPLLLAWLYLRRGQSQAALNQFRPLLSWCKRHHLPGTILQEGLPGQELLRLAIEKGVEAEFSQQLLVTAGVTGKLFPSSNPSVKIPHTNETLSSREAEVLRLLDNRATNREIAQELVITEQTVKTHLSHIMRKLDASNRAEVVKKARRLGLL